VEVALSTDGGRTFGDAVEARADTAGGFRVGLEGADAGPAVVRARAFDALGAGSLARSAGFGPPPAARASVAADVVTRGPFFEIVLPDTVPFASLAVAASESAACPVVPDGNGARIAVTAAGSAPPAEAIALEDPWGRPIAVEYSALPCAVPDQETRFSPSALAEVTFRPGTLREAAAVSVREVRWPGAKSELVPLGPPVAVDCGSVPFASDFEVLLRPAAAGGDPARVAVFVQEGGAFRYIGGREEPARGGWAAQVRTTAPVGLFADRTAPRIGDPRLEERSGRVRLRFNAVDRGAGLDCDGIRVLLDGQPVPNELDVDRGEVLAYPDLPPVAGSGGAFTVIVEDRCGNVSRWTRTVTLR
jgi:hypothetical protein